MERALKNPLFIATLAFLFFQHLAFLCIPDVRNFLLEHIGSRVLRGLIELLDLVLLSWLSPMASFVFLQACSVLVTILVFRGMGINFYYKKLKYDPTAFIDPDRADDISADTAPETVRAAYDIGLNDLLCGHKNIGGRKNKYLFMIPMAILFNRRSKGTSAAVTFPQFDKLQPHEHLAAIIMIEVINHRKYSIYSLADDLDCSQYALDLFRLIAGFDDAPIPRHFMKKMGLSGDPRFPVTSNHPCYKIIQRCAALPARFVEILVNGGHVSEEIYIHDEDQGKVLAWLEQNRDPNLWYQIAILQEEHDSDHVLEWILKQPECDWTTAFRMFETHFGSHFVGTNTGEFPWDRVDKPEWFQTIVQKICERSEGIGFTANDFALTPNECSYGWKNQDPVAVLAALTGELGNRQLPKGKIPIPFNLLSKPFEGAKPDSTFHVNSQGAVVRALP